MTNPRIEEAWQALHSLETAPLERLFQQDAERVTRASRTLSNIYFDWSKTHLDAAHVDAFLKLADAAGYRSKRDALFAGEMVNPSEGRPATHVAERGARQ